MKTQRIVLVAVAIAAAALFFWALRSPDLQPEIVTRKAANLPAHSKRVEPISGIDQSLLTHPVKHRTPENRSRIAVGDPLYSPATPEEAAWLEKNLFPSQAELESATASQALVSKLDISDGVSPTEILQAENIAMMDADSRKRAAGFLNRAAADGAIYALETLGRLNAIGALNDPVQSEAYYRAAEMLGDWGAAFRMHPNLPPQKELFATLFAHQIIDNLNLDRRRRGLPPLQRSPRPGLNERLVEVSSQVRTTQ